MSIINSNTGGYTISLTVIAMRVIGKRWGEVTVKRQGNGKNKFDASKSFSVHSSSGSYNIEQYIEVLKLASDLTDKLSFEDLKKKLMKVGEYVR